jgi:hypothetical protein
MPAVHLIFVPVPVSNGVGWVRRAKPAPYPREAREWGRREAIPAPDHRAVRALIADGKRIVAERRASRLLRELNGG